MRTAGVASRQASTSPSAVRGRYPSGVRSMRLSLPLSLAQVLMHHFLCTECDNSEQFNVAIQSNSMQ